MAQGAFVGTPTLSARLGHPFSRLQIAARQGRSGRSTLAARRCRGTIMSAADQSVAHTVGWTAVAKKIDPFWMAPEYETGPYRSSRPWEIETQRLFGHKEPALTFYRDTFFWCPYCEKVQLQLELKQIPYKIVKINMNCYGSKPAEFLRKVRNGLLPAVEMNGEVFVESTDIMYLIENRFASHHPLLPPKTDRQRSGDVDRMMKLERNLAGSWLNLLRGGGMLSALGRRAIQQDLDEVNETLGLYSDGPFFLGGNEPSLVDVQYCSFLERIAASVPYFQGLEVVGTGRWRHIEAWFEGMDSVPAYRHLKGDAYTHVRALPPQIGRCPIVESAKPFVDRVESAPLKQVLLFTDENRADRHEAAAAICRNYAAVTRDAMKGAQISADDVAFERLFDAALQCAAVALVDGPEAARATYQQSAPAFAASGRLDNLAAALAYEARRVCTPRDMSVAAAPLFQGALNFVRAELGAARAS
ncbi:Protein IN2-1-like A [Porphyridium purpureum]|uniref:Protein IN2-1-like A n=1 Tax=Porphyridium purpureum TaxID=35688 RepID=A0A5J4Z018_PORPP|nr:Protein IN2-1-like A [Porphyridium purpureum]|eukprot:POR8022..scf209_3